MMLGGERWRARRRLRRYAPFDDEARENQLVAAVGIVRPLDETLVAPLSGRACVAYRSRVRTHVLPSRETMQVRPFLLDLGDEEIVVEGERAIFGLPPIRMSPPDPERERSFLARHALVGASPPTWSALRFSEVALELGARVLVGGTLVLVPRDEPPEGELGFRDPPPPSQRIVGSRERPLVFVDPGDPAAG